MNKRRMTYVVCGLLVTASVVLWSTTGREGYTRWPDAKLAAADSPPVEGEQDLLSEIGFQSASAETAPPDIQSRFAFGLAPGGFDPKHLVSVAFVAGLAGVVAGGVTAATVMGRPER